VQEKKNMYLSYHRETMLQGELVMAKSGRLELQDNIYGHYRSIFNHWHVIIIIIIYLPAKQPKSVKKRKIRAITSFKVIQGVRARYQSKARMRLPISN